MDINTFDPVVIADRRAREAARIVSLYAAIDARPAVDHDLALAIVRDAIVAANRRLDFLAACNSDSDF
jgi:hypothetical protein